MSDLLYRVLLDRETDMVNEVHRQLIHSTSGHYEEMPWDLLLHRVESLTAYFMVALHETPDRFVDYVAEMAEARIGEGFRLAETLTAMRILEDQVWLIIVEDVPLPGRTAALAKITDIIGAAKHRLASVYLEHAHAEEDEPTDMVTVR